MTITNDSVPFDPEAALRRGDDDDENKGKGGFRKEPHWDLKKGEEGVLRFLTESADWFRARTHRFYPTKAQPADHEGKWPSMMPATCRQEPAFAHLYDGCPICTSGYKGDYSKGSQADDLRYTLAVEREQYTGDNGKKAYRDKIIDVPILDEKGKPTEEKVSVPSVVIVSNTMYMLMGALKACGDSYETLRDRDYKIKRVQNPSGTGTIYQTFPLDKTPDIAPGTDHWGYYELAVEALGLKLPTIIYNKSTDDYFKRFFLEDDGFTSADVRRENGELAPKSVYTAKPSPSNTSSSSSTEAPRVPDADALAAMKERVSRRKG